MTDELPRVDTPTDPAAGSNVVHTLKGGDAYRLKQFRFDATSTDGNLRAGVEIRDDDGNTVFKNTSDAAGSSGETIEVQAAPGLSDRGTQGPVRTVPMPEQKLLDDWEVRSQLEGAAASDTVTNAVVVYELLDVDPEELTQL